MDEKQNYFNIGKLTAVFEIDLKEWVAVHPESALQVMAVMCQLAQAQQLSVIASSLKRLEKAIASVPIDTSTAPHAFVGGANLECYVCGKDPKNMIHFEAMSGPSNHLTVDERIRAAEQVKDVMNWPDVEF